MQAKVQEHAGEVRPRYLTKGYLYNTAEDLRRTANRLMRDASEADESQAKLLRQEAIRLVQSADRFDAEAEMAREPEFELPFK